MTGQTSATPYSEPATVSNSPNGIIALLCTFLLSACGGPIGPIAGGSLEGELTPWPNDWSIAEDCENVLLETNPAKPYSVTIWGVGDQQNFYVAAGKRSNRWAQNIEQNPQVILDVDGKLYAAKAQRVVENVLFEKIRRGFVVKYDIDPDPDFKQKGAVYRLVPAR